MLEKQLKMEHGGREFKLENVLSEKQLHHILSKTAQPGAQIIAHDLRPATSGMVGFLGDHLRLTLHVKEDLVRKIHLFIKALPSDNQPKVDFITENFFYTREAVLYKLFEEIGDSNDKNIWRPKALIYSDNILVMPDLCAEGYRCHDLVSPFDKDHVMATLASIARFHATYSNYVTAKSKDGKPYDFSAEYGHVITEPTFRNCPWMDAAAKLTSNYLKTLSTHSKKYPDDLEKRIKQFYLKACESINRCDDTFSVIIHKDLWSNNILFKYSGDAVTNAVLVDFQCFRCAPPAFDIMQFLYFTTSRKFREQHEKEVLQHYYSVFTDSLDDDTKRRLSVFDYGFKMFLNWCDKARQFGMMEAATVLPFVLMDAMTAQKNFDNPNTFKSLLYEDRSAPVIEHARECALYKNRLLDIWEELVEKYILNH